MIARLALAAAALAATAAAAQAQDLHVRYGDLNLAQPAQAREFDRRVASAAADWCRDQTPTGRLLPATGCVSAVREQVALALPATARESLAAGRASTTSASVAPIR